MSASRMAGDARPAENHSEGSFLFLFLHFIYFDFKSEQAEIIRLGPARVVIKFHPASLPLGRDTII